MKAAICYEFGKPLVIEEVEIDSPKRDEVKIRLVAAGICYSDIHTLHGGMNNPLPLVAGHECSGYVEQVGENINNVKVGDPVIMSLFKSCGECQYCTSGFPHICEKQWSPESVLHLRNKEGKRLGCIVNMSGFAEYAIVHKSQVVALPKEMPLDRACLLGCSVITGFGAVVNRVQIKAMKSVVVFGTGGVGLNTIQGAALCGAYPLIAVDISDMKLKAARNFGATHTINAIQVNAVDTILQMTYGRGADYVFVTVGNINAMRQGLMMTGKRGTIIAVGVTTETMPVSPVDFILSERVLTGSNLGSTNLHYDIPCLVNLYLAGRLKLDELVTACYPFKRINDAIASFEKGLAIRNVVMFE